MPFLNRDLATHPKGGFDMPLNAVETVKYGAALYVMASFALQAAYR